VAKLPNPQLPLPELATGDVLTLEVGTLLWRVYRSASPHRATWSTFRRFGPVGNGRFDHHLPPPHEDAARGILFAALDIRAAIVESLQEGRLIDRFHEAPWLVGFELERDTQLLDLRGAWPTRAGASQAIATGPHRRAQAWSREFYAAYPNLVGVAYPSAMAGGLTNVALFERAADHLATRPRLHMPLNHPGLEAALNRIAATFNYDLR
jgi:hypothetical protein